MKAWLKGGLIIGIIFGILAFANVFIVADIEGKSSPIGNILENFDALNFFMGLISVVPLLFLGLIDWDGNQSVWLESNFSLISGIINLIFYFIVGFILGAIIGFFIGKIKPENKFNNL